MPKKKDLSHIPRAYHHGVDMLDTRNWSDSAFEHGPPLPQPDFSGLARAGKRLPAVGPMDTWGTRMVKSGAFAETDVWGNPKEEEYEVHYPHEPPAGCMWIVEGLPKPYQHGRTPRELYEDTFDDFGNLKPQYPDYFEPGNGVRLRSDPKMVGMLGWIRWTYGESDPEPEDICFETLDQFLRRYHLVGWVRMANGEVHRVEREEVEACDLPDAVLAECKEFIDNNYEFNEDMWNRAKFGDEYQAEFDKRDAYDLEREQFRRSGEKDPEAERKRAEYEKKNPLPPNLGEKFFSQFEPDYDPQEQGEVPDEDLPGRKRLDHSKYDGTWEWRKDIDPKGDLAGHRPHVQYW